MRPFFLAVFVTLAAGAHAGQTTATTEPQSEFIRDIGNRAVAMLQANNLSASEREAGFRKIMTSGFDLDFVGRYVLGRHWRTATDEQRAAFLKVFAEYVVKTYATRLEGYSGETFEVITQRAATKRDTIVRTRIARPGGAPIIADWRVRHYDAGPRIIDVMVEGISMAVTQRQEFDAVVRRVGVDGLISELQKRTDPVGQTVSARN